MLTTLLLALILATPPAIPDELPPAIPDEAAAEKPLTYAEAHALAVREGKPLVVWVGGNFCQACVRDSAAEFVHVFVDRFDGVAAPAIVVGVVADGELVRAGDVTWWITGDREFGHVPSIRHTIRRWADAREQSLQASRRAAIAPVRTTAPARRSQKCLS